MDAADNTFLPDGAELRIDGLVGGDPALAIGRLLELVTGMHSGRPSIALVDVLAEVRLGSDADVVLFHGIGPAIHALAVHTVVRHPNIRLVIGRAGDAAAVLLDAPECTGSDEPVPVLRITAVTFAEFVAHHP